MYTWTYTGTTGSIAVPTRRGPRHMLPPPKGLVLTGVVGSIQWGYYTAAGIHGYRIVRSKDGLWSLTATVVLSDAFKMAQTPLTFVALRTTKGLDGICVVKTEWRWPMLATSPIDPNTKQVTARLGPPIA